MAKELKFAETLVCKKCDFLDQQAAAPQLTMPEAIWRAWKVATRVNEHLEILALFRVDDQGVITELHIPKQEVEAASCTLLGQEGHWDGMIHSHHSMGASFSQMDDNTVLPNYRYSIVTNHKNESSAVERVDLPCGGMGFRPLKVALETTADDQSIIDLVKAQCETPAQRVQVWSPHYQGTAPVDTTKFHTQHCTCAACVWIRKNEGAAKANDPGGDRPFGMPTTGTPGADGRDTKPGGRFFTTEVLPSARNGHGRGKRGKRGRERQGERASLWDVPTVMQCSGTNCTKLIYGQVDDWGTDAMGNPLCAVCWERMYESLYGGNIV